MARQPITRGRRQTSPDPDMTAVDEVEEAIDPQQDDASPYDVAESAGDTQEAPSDEEDAVLEPEASDDAAQVADADVSEADGDGLFILLASEIRRLNRERRHEDSSKLQLAELHLHGLMAFLPGAAEVAEGDLAVRLRTLMRLI
jgi:hypothetical protein